jgi:hypothetical protein
VSFAGFNLSGSLFGASGTVSIGTFDAPNESGYYITYGGTVSGSRSKFGGSASVEGGGSTNEDSFFGPSAVLTVTGGAEGISGAGSLSTNSSGTGWSLQGGLGTPGMSVAGGATKTKPFFKSPHPKQMAPKLRAPADATATNPNHP